MPRRPDRYLEERRRDILRAARDAFVKDGYAGTTVSKIAQEAEMAAGTLYRYFDSKEDLIWAVAHEHIEEELTRFSVAGDGLTLREINCSLSLRTLGKVVQQRMLTTR